MRCRRCYKAARSVLPPGLLREIQEHFEGGYLYVPRRARTSRLARNVEIVGLYNAGRTVTEIAERYLLSRSAVRKVLKKPGGTRRQT